jgi:hypothetical protein
MRVKMRQIRAIQGKRSDYRQMDLDFFGRRQGVGRVRRKLGL